MSLFHDLHANHCRAADKIEIEEGACNRAGQPGDIPRPDLAGGLRFEAGRWCHLVAGRARPRRWFCPRGGITPSTSRQIPCSRTSARAGRTRSALSCFALKTLPGNSWAISNRMKQGLALLALNMAIHCPAGDVLHRREGRSAGRHPAAFITRIAPLTVFKKIVAGQWDRNTVPTTIRSCGANTGSRSPLSRM